VRTYEAVIERYLRGVHVADESWFTTVHEIYLCPRRLAAPLLGDVHEAVRLYEKYLEACPERTCDEARYRLAALHASHLDDAEKATTILEKVPQVSARESRILEYQDEIFRQRLNSLILDALRARCSRGLSLQRDMSFPRWSEGCGRTSGWT